ncbi:hypothetical protein ABL78_0408 [Leptomonas seymouri]|uniref:Uncharacterized protein n=1 Tax=Leptomonas seymouri TaxID=5684 RepID=A0A0N1I8V5_LEPSE|nr:hypothetical protein ABL78_0408 [Leptomonas seymouri]|eukprot:KPI90478.1 hypothetical protein ABL78_0408 [Leptomonas seymouri]
MPGEEDAMMALVESWDTFLVEPTAALMDAHKSFALPHAGEDSCTATSLLRAPRTFLSDALPPLSFLGGSESQPLESLNTSSTDAAPPLLWLLTLVSRNVELLRAAAHLFLQFNAQFAALVDANERAMDDLRGRHQQQLTSLLEVADTHTTSDMIVDSLVTERLVHQQEQELNCLERQCAAAERQLELQLQETLFAFLHTSAPDAVAAANRKEDSLCWVGGSSTGGNHGSCNGVGADGLYRAEVDVSRFAEIRKAAPRNPRQSTSAVAPFSPLRLVPVRTIRLSNEVGNASANLTDPSTRKRAKDATLQPIILDVSPLSGLTCCLVCCSGTHPGAVSSSVSSAAEEHLLRLAHTRHSVLLLIGSEAAALEVVAACKAPELLLGAAHSCREGFKPLPHHSVLRVLFTTRLWGANVVLLWSPSQEARHAPSSSSTSSQAVVEDALELAYAWDADMFSVAVLEGTRLPLSASLAATTPETAPTAQPSSPAAAFFAAHALSMEVLRQLRNGVTRELLETAGRQRARCWQGSTAWLLPGVGSADTAGTHMCPRAVGVLYASQAAGAAALGDSIPVSASSAAAAVASSPSSIPSSATPSPQQSAASSPTSAFRGPPVTFNTPLAIRAFLPLPEEYFVKGRPNSRDADKSSFSSSSSGSRGERGSRYGANNSSGQVAWWGGGAVAATEAGVEDSRRDAMDFSHGVFTRRSLRAGLDAGPRNGGDGDTYATDSHGGAFFPQERHGEAMGFDALIHYAFGEFAEAL